MEDKTVMISQIIMQMMDGRGLSVSEEEMLAGLLEEGRRKRERERKEPTAFAVPSRPGVKYIQCPYSERERELIMEWISRNENEFDVKSQALALWLAGEIAPREIANLRTEDWKGGKTAGEGAGFDRGASWQRSRAEIMKKTLELHPEGLEYVFMHRKGSEWTKLKSGSLQMKMYNICDELGIVYKSFRQNEAIRYDGK